MSVDSQIMGTTNVFKEFTGLGVGQEQTEHNAMCCCNSRPYIPKTGAVCSSLSGKAEVPPV